jgi:hypothetical protein
VLPLVVPLCLWVLCFGAGATLVRRKAREAWVPLATAVFFSAVLVTLVSQVPFWGLEYEDAFEYVYSSRLLAADPSLGRFGLNPICIQGSLASCEATATLSHPLGATSFWVFSAWLEIPTARAAVALVCGFAAVVSILLGVSWRQRLSPAQIMVSIAVIFSPVVCIYGASGFSEVMGSLAISLLVLADRSEAHTSGDRRARLILLFASSALLPMIKRELILLPVFVLISYLLDLASRKREVVAVAAGCVVAVATMRSVLLDFDMARTSDLQVFSAQSFRVLLPEFIKTLLTHFVFMPYGLLLLAALGISWYRPRSRYLPLALAGFVVVFLSFSQSYYFAMLGEIPTVHFERYAFQLWPLVLLAWGDFLARFDLRGWFSRKAKVAGAILAVVLLGLTSRIAVDRHQEELEVRFAPVRTVIAESPAGAWIVTTEPILYSLIDPGRRTLDLPSLPRLMDSASTQRILDSGLVVSATPQDAYSAADRQRYSAAFAVLETILRTQNTQSLENSKSLGGSGFK